MTSWSHGPAGPFRAWLAGAHLWSNGAREVGKVLSKAARRSSEETRAVLDVASAAGMPDIAALARLGDLSRAS